ncbi:MAG TPA: arginyltransferase [Paenalcaligenes sp.]|nr:arginyltransferase [Paenalcaligenes sp.]
MGNPDDLRVHTLHFYKTANYPCSYLPQQQARSLVAAPAHYVDTAHYGELIQQGFRRSGTFSYRPACDTCQACTPIRVDCQHFVFRRSLRRIQRQHQDLTVTIRPLSWNSEHFDLYVRYQHARHPESVQDSTGRSEYIQYLLASHVHSRLIEFRTPQGKLMAVALTDFINHGLSAVYTFFCPDAQGSLGTYVILWQIKYAQRLGLPWLYLGYWIEQSHKMSYKTRFHPYQLYKAGQWVDSKE